MRPYVAPKVGSTLSQEFLMFKEWYKMVLREFVLPGLMLRHTNRRCLTFILLKHLRSAVIPIGRDISMFLTIILNMNTVSLFLNILLAVRFSL